MHFTLWFIFYSLKFFTIVKRCESGGVNQFIWDFLRFSSNFTCFPYYDQLLLKHSFHKISLLFEEKIYFRFWVSNLWKMHMTEHIRKYFCKIMEKCDETKTTVKKKKNIKLNFQSKIANLTCIKSLHNKFNYVIVLRVCMLFTFFISLSQRGLLSCWL